MSLFASHTHEEHEDEHHDEHEEMEMVTPTIKQMEIPQ
jgi:hypothetical protein